MVLTFGKYTDTAPPGLHFKFPWPIQTVEKVPVGRVNRIEIGFRSIKVGDTITYDTFMSKPDLVQVAQMLTGDENVVNCSMAVQYRDQGLGGTFCSTSTTATFTAPCRTWARRRCAKPWATTQLTTC